MKNIFLAPRSNETSHKNFASTIEQGVSFSLIAPHLTSTEKSLFVASSKIKVWGAKASLRNRWNIMQPGDYVLFYRDGSFYYSAEVVLTKFDESLSKKLWPLDKKNNLPWPCLFFVKNVREINIPIRTLQELASYKPTWDRVQGFMSLNELGLNAIKEKFGSIPQFLHQKPLIFHAIDQLIEERTEEHLEYSLQKRKTKYQLFREAADFSYTPASHKLSTSPKRVRIDNQKQKRTIAELEGNACQICNWKLVRKHRNGEPIYRIDVDHIKEKAAGGNELMKNLWVLCPNCHAKKTCGVITLDLKKKKVFENGKPIPLHHDSHLFTELTQE